MKVNLTVDELDLIVMGLRRQTNAADGPGCYTRRMECAELYFRMKRLHEFAE